MQKRKYTSLFLVLAMVVSLAVPVFAATTEEKITQAREEQQETRSQLSSVQNRIQELDSKRGETEGYLSELTRQLEELTSRLTELQAQYAAKQMELVAVQEELDGARAKEEAEYQAMKLRIQYMYETSCTSNFFAMICNAQNLSDLVSRVEYFKTISEYDKSLTEEYHNTVLDVQAKESRVEEEKAAIETLQKENTEQQEAIQEVYAATYNDLRDCLAEMDAAEADQNSLAARIEEQENIINALIRRAKEEEMEAQRKAAAEAAARAAKEAQEAASQAAHAQAEAQRQAAEEAAAKAEAAAQAAEKEAQAAAQQAEQQAAENTQPAEAPAEQVSAGSSRTYLGNFRTTAYCACSKCCGKWAGGHTASGTVPTAGRTVAMGGVPFGTKLEVNGHVYIVEDRGTAYGHVDIFFDSHQEALQYGMKNADVYQVD